MGIYDSLTQDPRQQSPLQPTKPAPRPLVPFPWSGQPGGQPAPSNQPYPGPKQTDEFVDFWGGNNQRFSDILRRGYGNLLESGPDEIGAGRGQLNRLQAYSRAGTNLAGASLNEILANRGQADPMLMNLLLAKTSRDNEGAQAALRDRLARAGLGQSGIGVATGAAVDAAGANRAAGIRAQDLAQSEDRRRGDINLATSFYTDPLMQALGIGHGVATQGSALKAAQGNSTMQWISALLGGAGSIVDLFKKKDDD